MKKLFKYLRPYKWQAIIVIVLTTVQSISQLYLPNLMSDIVDKGVVGQDVGLIIQTGLIMLGFTLIVSICTIVARLFASRTAVGFARDLRHDIFSKVENYSLDEFDKIGTASLITRSTNDVTQIQNVMVMILSMLLAAPIMAAGGHHHGGAQRQRPFLADHRLHCFDVAVCAACGMESRAALQITAKEDRPCQSRAARKPYGHARHSCIQQSPGTRQKRFDEANSDLTNTSIAPRTAGWDC